MIHKPNCSININCLVYHADGICNHERYGKCDCGLTPITHSKFTVNSEGKIITLMPETKQKEIRDWEEKLLDITSMVSFCPHCLMYGTPLGLRDKICGNCGKNGLRNYIKLSSVQSFISTLLAERDAEVRKLIAMLPVYIRPIQVSENFSRRDGSAELVEMIRLDDITNKLDGK